MVDRLIGQIPDEKNRRHECYFSEARPWMKSLRSKVGHHFILAAQKPGRGQVRPDAELSELAV
jgi:hypothetical protein